MRALLIGGLVLAMAFVAGTEAFVPSFLAERVAGGLKEALGDGTVRVQLAAFPALRLLAGDVDRMTVTVEGLVVDGLALDSLRLEAANVHVDLPGLLRGRDWRPSYRDEVTVEAVITENALTELVRARLPAQVDVAVRLDAGGVELSGRTEVLGLPMDVNVRGRVAAEQGGTRLVFVPEQIVVGGQVLADWVAQGIRQMYTAAVDLRGAPVPLVVEEVVHEPGRLVIAGRPFRDG